MKIEVCKGSVGLALYVDDKRVAGARHNGLMETVLSAVVPAPSKSHEVEGRAMSGFDIAGLVEELRRAILRATADEVNGQPSGNIITKGCEAAEYVDPDDATGAFVDSIVDEVVSFIEAATSQRDEALAALKASEERGERLSQELASARLRPEPCVVCGGLLTWSHDHRSDNTGLDDGPPLNPPRNKSAPKPADEIRDIRARAWATRRQKYGQQGHR